MFRVARISLAVIVLVATMGLLTILAHAGDWPQILGPNRNGVAEGERLADSWPKDGPVMLWEHAVGEGFAGPAVIGDRVVIYHRQRDVEITECLEASTGKTIWRAEFPTTYRPSISPDGGPRCTPLVAGDRVYLFGAAAGLHCVGLADGKTIWSRELAQDYSLWPSYFGAGSSPLLVDDLLLLNLGARDGAGLVAVDAAKGTTRWAKTDERASYSSPVIANVVGRRFVVFATRMNVLTLDPKTGEVLGSLPFGKTGPTVVAANPVVAGNRVLFSAAYGVGTLCAEISPTGALSQVWRSDVMSSQYSTSIAVGEVLYGVDGRDDVGPTALRCFELATGRERWSETGFGVASLLAAGDKLLAVHTDGRATLLRINANAYQPLAAAKLFRSETRALPALSEGKLYVRDRSRLACFKVGE